MAARYSLPTINWVRFGGGDGEVASGEPSPQWPLEAVLDAAAAAGFVAIGLDQVTVGCYVASGERSRTSHPVADARPRL